MSKHQPAFALIGRSFPSEVFERLYEASQKAPPVAPGRGQALGWREAGRSRVGSGERVNVPMRLPG